MALQPIPAVPRMNSRQKTSDRRAPDATAAANGVGLPVLGGLLFASGLTALVYQLLWIKQLSLIVGVDVYAVTIALSAFFAGLGGGSYLLGRRADRSVRPLRLYALLELGIALCGIATTFSLAHSAALFVALEDAVGPLAWLLPFAAIGIPALLMGGTLPVLLRAHAPSMGKIAGSGGGLYAANTCGAVCGALVVSFALIPAFGIFGAALFAAAMNIALSALAFGIGGSIAPHRIEPQRRASIAPAQKHRAFAIYAIAGGLALGYEVVWSQAAIQFMSTRSFAFSIVLATYLTGLMLGSAIYARSADRVRDPWGAFAVLIAGAGLLALLQVCALGPWLPQVQAWAAQQVLDWSGSQFAAMCVRFAIASASIVLAPTLLLGAAFPLALRLATDEGQVGRDTGSVLALNTLGGIAGTAFAGFVLLPLLGLVQTLSLLAAGAVALGWYALLRGSPSVRTGPRLALAGISLALALGIAATPPQRFAQMLTAAHRGELIYYGENPGGTVAVIEQATTQDRFRRLYIQGVSNSGDAMPSLRYMRLQALLPLLIQRNEPRSALVVALGTGITAGALTQYPGLEQRVCVELLPAVVDAAKLFSGNYRAADDARVEIRVRDGRRELLRDATRYDLITLEPPPPSAAGVANLYSRDFYELASARLQPGGLFAQWLPLATQNNEDTRALVRSFLDAFPYATLWTTELHETLLVGSLQPIELDADRIAQRFNQPSVRAALGEVGIDSPQALLATWVMDRTGLEQYAAAAEPVTDDRPRIEYAQWLRRGEFARVLPQLLALRSAPPLRANAEFSAQVEAEWNHLHTFYEAGLHAYRGDRASWSDALGSIATEIDANPYYRWTIKGF